LDIHYNGAAVVVAGSFEEVAAALRTEAEAAMAAVAVAVPAEAQIPGAFATAAVDVAGTASSEEADVVGAASSEETGAQLRTETEASAVAVAVQRVEAQIPVEEAALVASAALRAEAVVQIPVAVAEQEELRTDCNAAAVQVPMLMHRTQLAQLRGPNVTRTGRSASVQEIDR
jgi:hypothetical protein